MVVPIPIFISNSEKLANFTEKVRNAFYEIYNSLPSLFWKVLIICLIVHFILRFCVIFSKLFNEEC